MNHETESERGWNKAFAAHSPSTCCFHSPVIPTEGKLCPSTTTDGSMMTTIWSLITQEEYYYQNFIELLSTKRHDYSIINKLLRVNRVPSYWQKRLINFYPLGSGCFGTVYKAEDKYSGSLYAVKEVTSHSKKTLRILSDTLTILTERNAFFRSNDSAFIVKLHGAFQDSKLRSYWMVFEYCIGDLQKYVEFISIDILIYFNNLLRKNVTSELYRLYYERLQIDVESLACLFGFELLSGLAYFGRRNLLHNDLKPANVLISSSGHVKITDLGLTQRIKWSDRRSAIHFAKPANLKNIQEKDIGHPRVGNLKYADPESIIYYEEFIPQSEFYDKFLHPDLPVGNGEQDFLSDLYGVALIIVDMLFVSMNPINSYYFTLTIRRRFNIGNHQSNVGIFSSRCTYDNIVVSDYLQPFFKLQQTEQTKSIVEFLLSCFKSRRNRALDYTVSFLTRRMKKTYTSRSVDINKVENIEYYKTRNITQYNVCNYTLPDAFFKIFYSPNKQMDASNFDELLRTRPVRGTGREHEISMKPFEFVA